MTPQYFNYDIHMHLNILLLTINLILFTGIVSIPYGTDKTITCDITSISSMDIVWYISKKTEVKQIKSSDDYVISEDKKQLTIKSMNSALEGKYFCKAHLTDDANIDTQLNVATITTDGLCE